MNTIRTTLLSFQARKERHFLYTTNKNHQFPMKKIFIYKKNRHILSFWLKNPTNKYSTILIGTINLYENLTALMSKYKIPFVRRTSKSATCELARRLRKSFIIVDGYWILLKPGHKSSVDDTPIVGVIVVIEDRQTRPGLARTMHPFVGVVLEFYVLYNLWCWVDGRWWGCIIVQSSWCVCVLRFPNRPRFPLIIVTGLGFSRIPSTAFCYVFKICSMIENEYNKSQKNDISSMKTVHKWILWIYFDFCVFFYQSRKCVQIKFIYIQTLLNKYHTFPVFWCFFPAEKGIIRKFATIVRDWDAPLLTDGKLIASLGRKIARRFSTFPSRNLYTCVVFPATRSAYKTVVYCRRGNFSILYELIRNDRSVAGLLFMPRFTFYFLLCVILRWFFLNYLLFCILFMLKNTFMFQISLLC